MAFTLGLLIHPRQNPCSMMEWKKEKGLSDSYLKLAEFNTVDNLIDKSDGVGFEPTT